MKNVIKQIIEWGLAIICGLMVANLICFAYDRPAPNKLTPNGVSMAVKDPNFIFVRCSEGYAVGKVDRNGFNNPDKELADDYVLVMGASHTSGREVPENQRFSSLIDQYYNDEKLHAYNIAFEGQFLPTLIKHFKAAMEAFPNLSVVTMEIYMTDFSVEELRDAIDQVDYDPEDSVAIFQNLSFMEKVKLNIRRYLPLYVKLRSNLDTMKKANSGSDADAVQIDHEEYEKVINEALALLRSECDKPILIVYHPAVKLRTDGSLLLEYSDTWDIFKEACYNNGIDLIDSGDDYLEYYNKYDEIAYGFSNTSPCEGHINKLGHRIMADEIIEYLEALK